MKIIEVAAAVLQRPDGSFLLAQRPSDKIWAGYWEFPGGKVEPGESAYQALVRELYEELGIVVETAYPWVTRVFTYPHATVRLSFFRVIAWNGELISKEGQAFLWEQPLTFSNEFQNVSVSPVLPANSPILRALSLPPLYAISNAQELGEDSFLLKMEYALKKGLRLIQLREKDLSPDNFRTLALKALTLTRQYGAKLLLNSDVTLAQELGGDGVHLTSRQLWVLNDRPEVTWCGASCHSSADLRRAETLGCDFAVLSPVLPTQSHPEVSPLGWETFAAISAGASIPIFALGGLRREDSEIAWQHGAHGVALMRQAWSE